MTWILFRSPHCHLLTGSIWLNKMLVSQKLVLDTALYNRQGKQGAPTKSLASNPSVGLRVLEIYALAVGTVAMKAIASLDVGQIGTGQVLARVKHIPKPSDNKWLGPHPRTNDRLPMRNRQDEEPPFASALRAGKRSDPYLDHWDLPSCRPQNS